MWFSLWIHRQFLRNTHHRVCTHSKCVRLVSGYAKYFPYFFAASCYLPFSRPITMIAFFQVKCTFNHYFKCFDYLRFTFVNCELKFISCIFHYFISTLVSLPVSNWILFRSYCAVLLLWPNVFCAWISSPFHLILIDHGCRTFFIGKTCSPVNKFEFKKKMGIPIPVYECVCVCVCGFATKSFKF